MLRARGKGVLRRDGQAGDLLVTVEVEVPTTVSDEAREALEEFAMLRRRRPGGHRRTVRRHESGAAISTGLGGGEHL